MRDTESCDETQWAGSEFETTRWDLLVAARKLEGAEAEAAMKELATQYREPLVAYARWLLRDADSSVFGSAEDAAHGFLEAKVLNGRLLADADSRKGSFRRLFKKSFQNWLAGEARKQVAVKRGGGRVEPIELLGCTLDPRAIQGDEAYDQKWASGLMDSVIREIAVRADAADALLLEHVTSAPGTFELGNMAEELGMSTNSLSQRLRRLRRDKVAAELRKRLRQGASRDPDTLREEWHLLGEMFPFLKPLAPP